MLYARRTDDPLARVEAVCDKGEIVRGQEEVRNVEVKDSVGRYLLAIVHETRKTSGIERGISPRGALAFFRAAQARAFLHGRSYVSPEDIQSLAGPVLAHRVQLTTEARYGGSSAEELVAKLTRSIRVPT